MIITIEAPGQLEDTYGGAKRFTQNRLILKISISVLLLVA